MQPITNPLLYGLNFVLNPQPAMQPTPCPGSWFTNEGEEEAAEAVAGAAPAPAPALVAASGGQE